LLRRDNLKKKAVIIITVTTIFQDSIFYKPAETYTILTEKEYKVNGEIAQFLAKLGKREGKNLYSL
jgi:hypothetical protein